MAKMFKKWRKKDKSDPPPPNPRLQQQTPMQPQASSDMSVQYDEGAVPEPPRPHEKNIKIHQRYQNIFAKPIEINSDFVLPVIKKTEASIQFIDNSLADNFIFASLTNLERRNLIDAMEMETLLTSTPIIQQGEVGDYFYVVEDGQVSFSVDGKHVGSCSRGGSFGELALLYNCPRAATCVALTDCKLWKVDQKTFRYMLANNTANQQKDIQDVLRKVPFL